jgi:hypothetical protein
MPRTAAAHEDASPHTDAAHHDDARTIDSTTTGQRSPTYMDTGIVAQRLKEQGTPVSKQTLARHRSEGIGLRWRYYGQTPVVSEGEYQRYLREDLFADESPLAGRKHRRASPRRSSTPSAAPVQTEACAGPKRPEADQRRARKRRARDDSRRCPPA